MLIEKKDKPFTDSIHELVVQYAPLRRKLMQDSVFYDADDLLQELWIKLIKRFKTEKEWLDIGNQRAYVVRATLATSITLRARSKEHHENIDDEDNVTLNKYLSDEGSSCERINRSIDYSQTVTQINKMLEEFSDYEKLLINLNFIEGCKPCQVASLLANEYPEILEKTYPGTLPVDSEAKKDKLKKIVQTDCNAVAAKLRQRLKKKLAEKGNKSGKHKSNNK